MSHIYLNCIYYGCKCQEQMQVLSIVLIIQLKILLFSLCFFQNISQRPIFSYLFTEVHGFFFRQKIALFGHFPLNHILFLKPSRNKSGVGFFYSWQLRKRRHFWCSQKFFWPFLFCDGFSTVQWSNYLSMQVQIKPKSINFGHHALWQSANLILPVC